MHCSKSIVFRRVRPIRRFRSVVRGLQAQSQDSRSAHSIPRTDLRRNQYPSLHARLALAEDDRVWFLPPKGRVMSDEILRRHQLVWQQKPILRLLYREWYQEIAEWLQSGRTLEVGRGTGNLKEFAPSVVCTD